MEKVFVFAVREQRNPTPLVSVVQGLAGQVLLGLAN